MPGKHILEKEMRIFELENKQSDTEKENYWGDYNNDHSNYSNHSDYHDDNGCHEYNNS